jgi:secreted Zn-dependent insulinase-like peptidase
MIQRQANSFTYYASLADLSMELSLEFDGVLLEIAGFDDKQGVLLQKVLELLNGSTLDLNQSRFDVAKESIGDSLRNSVFDLTYKYFPLYLSPSKL